MAAADTLAMDPGRELLFTAELRPHRSLSALGFRILMGGAGALFLAVGTVFFIAGAWPVVGFLGLELALLYGAFKVNYARARSREYLLLSENALVVRRVDPARRERVWRLQPTWLRVAMPVPESDRDQLVLSSHGRRLTIGAFLAPEQRVALAVALRAALARLDNVHYR